MNKQQFKTIETYTAVMNISGTAHVLRTVVRLGIINVLMERQHTAVQLAEKLKLRAEPLELLLQVACETGLIEKYGDDYALSQVGRMLPSDFHDLGDRYWQYLDNFVRTAQRIPDDTEIPQQDGDYLAEAATSEWIATPAALEAISILEIPENRNGKQILEIGTGSGVFGMSILHNDPTSHLTALDDARGLKRTETTAEAIGKDMAVSYIEADYRVADYPLEEFDLVIIENVLHRETLPLIKDIFSRVKRSLKSGGEVAILDVFPGQEKGSMSRSLFQLSLHMRLSTGSLHDPLELQTVLQEVGFSDITFAHLKCPPYLYGLLVAKLD